MRLLPHGMKIGHATVIVDIVPKGNPEIRPGILMKAKGITDHDTGNSGRGADAKAHNRLLHNWGNLPVKDTSHVSWHGALDEDFIIQHIPFDEPAYHCGDGWGLNSGNRNTIGFEKCMHQGADRQKIEENAIALYAYLMKEMDFPITWIRPHQYWSGKYCPQLILNKYGSFLPFRNKVEAAYKGGVIQVSNPVRDYYLHGDNGTGVKNMQSDLVKAGFKLSIDTYFGDETEKVVKAFQKANGLIADGIWGKASQAKMDAILANLNKPAAPKPVPVVIPKEEDEMLKQAIVIGSLNDYAAAEILSVRKGIPIYPRNAIKGEVAKELIVVGGSTKGLKAAKVTILSGDDRFETADNVEQYLKK